MTTKKEDPKPDALATVVANAGMELEPAPDYIQQGREGLETISKSDVLIPRLALAQANSPEVTEGDPKYREGMRPGDLFNSLTGQNYGREVFVQILRKDNLRAMEFFPLDDGGGVADPDVPLDDPRLKWGADGSKPIATLFRDYIAVLLPTREVIALSFKSSGIKVAKNLNGLIMMRNRPIYAGKYVITTDTELKPKPHKVYKVANAGWVSEEDARLGKQMFDAVKDIEPSMIHRDNNNDDPFIEEEPGTTTGPGASM